MRGGFMSRIKGKVKWFSNRKGYGFLDSDQNSNDDVFVHFSAILEEGYKSLHEGDEVEYDLLEGNKGPQAQNVVKVPSATSETNTSATV